LASTTEDVIVRYRAEVDQLEKELDVIILKQSQIVKGEDKVNDQTKKATTSLEFAAKKRKELIVAEEAELRKLYQLKKLAFDPKQINQYNNRIAESKGNISTLKGELGGFGKSATSIFAGIGAGIAAAFSVGAVINFGRASITAFIEAEQNANKLKFAITSIGGEGEAAFNRLIKQSEKLQKLTIFSDDSIQQAQAALAAFGLTSDEIEKLIPKLADFATVTSQDIVSAAQQIGGALEGNGREFKKYGIEVSATASRTENLGEVMNGLTKFTGAAEEATKSLSGQMKVAENAASELEEQIGEQLAPSWVKLKVSILQAAEALLRYGKINEITRKDIVKQTESAAQQVIASVKEKNLGSEQEIIVLRKLAEETLYQQRVLQLDLDLRTKSGKLTRFEADKIKDKIAVQKALTETYILEIDAIQRSDEAKQKSAEDEKKRILEITELRKKSTEQLLELQEKETEIGDKPSKQNIKNIQEIIKLREDAAKELIKNQKLLADLQIQNIEDERARRIAQFEREIKDLTAQGKLRADIVKEMAKQLRADLEKFKIDLIIPIKARVIVEPEAKVVNDIPEAGELTVPADRQNITDTSGEDPKKREKDIEETNPEAVIETPYGLAVDYSKIGVDFRRVYG